MSKSKSKSKENISSSPSPTIYSGSSDDGKEEEELGEEEEKVVLVRVIQPVSKVIRLFQSPTASVDRLANIRNKIRNLDLFRKEWINRHAWDKIWVTIVDTDSDIRSEEHVYLMAELLEAPFGVPIRDFAIGPTEETSILEGSIYQYFIRVLSLLKKEYRSKSFWRACVVLINGIAKTMRDVEGLKQFRQELAYFRHIEPENIPRMIDLIEKAIFSILGQRVSLESLTPEYYDEVESDYDDSE